MVTIVIAINLLIALLCLYVAWRIWKLRLILARVADTLLAAERSTHAVLYGAPKAITKGQKGVYQLRQRYQQLEPQLQKAQQALALLSFGQTLWQRSQRGQLRPLSKRKPSARRRAGRLS